MKKYVRFPALLLVLSLLPCLSGCTFLLERMQDVSRAEAESESEIETEKSEDSWFYDPPMLSTLPDGTLVTGVPVAADPHDEPDATANGARLCFVSNEVKATWREPLLRLLSDIQSPDAPSHAYACSLFDVTMDGTPELLVLTDGFGSTTMEVEMTVYDLHAGEVLGALSTDMFGGFDVYSAADGASLYAFTAVSLRDGADTSIRLLSPIAHAEDRGYYTPEYLRADFLYNFETSGTASAEDEDNGLVQFPLENAYTLYGNRLTPAEYAEEYAWFIQHFTRIPETHSRMLLWSDVAKDDDTEELRSEKMADALLALEQEFICFE